MLNRLRQTQFPTLLAVTAVGIYLLVVVGATAAIADATRACSGWPVCAGPLTDPLVAVAVGHRVVAAAVGALVLVTGYVGLTSDASRRVKAALLVGLGLYPAQVGLGALVATTGAAGLVPVAHLVTAMAIFGAVVLALAWTLEAQTGTPGESPMDLGVDEPIADETERPPLSSFPLGTRVKATVGAYFRLMKPRLMWLLCLVASAGMALGAGPDLTARVIVLTLGGGVLAIGASGTFNHILERDVDKRMSRTADRPVATHQVPVRNAAVFGGLLTVAALALFAQVNLLAAALGLSAILFYSVVYTLVLKPNTVQNTVIGGFAGALPALIGSAAVTGRIGLPGLMLAGVIFLWTPAHFYNLALAYKEDYARGGFPMMPVVRGETETRKHILYYLGATLLAASALSARTDLGWVYAAATTVVGAVFLWAVWRLHREQTEAAAFRAFHASNAYLGALLVAILVDTLAV